MEILTSDQVLEGEPCKHCEKKGGTYIKLSFFKNPSYKDIKDPKIAFHVQLRCKACKRYLKNLKQTMGTIEFLLAREDMFENKLPI